MKTLEQAVRQYLDEFYQADEGGDRIPWPSELEEVLAWTTGQPWIPPQ